MLAALDCFSQDSYEAVGIRQVAAKAGVSPGLVVRYFGPKEELYKETLRKAFVDLDMGRFVEGDLTTLGEHMVRELLKVRFTRSLRTTVRATANAQTAAFVRDLIAEYFCDPLARRLSGENSELRAAIVSAQFFGFAVYYYLVEVGAIARGDPEAVIAQISRALQTTVGA
jgi:AcrR family transcriptional regulator